MKKVLLIALFLVFLATGVGCTLSAMSAGVQYNLESLSADVAGDYSKAQQKANDAVKHIESVRKKWIGLWIAAAVSYTVSIASLVMCFIKPKSENVRE